MKSNEEKQKKISNHISVQFVQKNLSLQLLEVSRSIARQLVKNVDIMVGYFEKSLVSFADRYLRATEKRIKGVVTARSTEAKVSKEFQEKTEQDYYLFRMINALSALGSLIFLNLWFIILMVKEKAVYLIMKTPTLLLYTSNVIISFTRYSLFVLKVFGTSGERFSRCLA